MIVGSDERRFAWMDEGTTSFNENAAEAEFYPGVATEREDYEGYLMLAGSDFEDPIMRWSDYHSNPMAYTTASYGKPATNLWMLRALLGEDRFVDALQTFVSRWAYKHPLPWDLFHTFDDVTGEDLGWFWRTWYYETWTLDQAVADVRLVDGGTKIVVEDRGMAPMPARLTLTLANGEAVEAEIPVTVWLSGKRSAEIVVKTTSPVMRVEIDAAQAFPDTDRANNVWERT
jgi:aminopeptidase N